MLDHLVVSVSDIKDWVFLVAKNLNYSFQVGYEIGKTLTYPSLLPAFFTGKEIIPGVPHVNAKTPLGYIDFNADLTDTLKEAALSTSKGIATFWAGPFLPVIYVATNEARCALIKEGHIGSINEETEKYLDWLTGGNHVMSNFLAFISVYSQRYHIHRNFLLNFFLSGAKNRLPVISQATENFLRNYADQQGETPHSLREFITLLVLYTSSQMLSLTHGLDEFYLEKQEYREAINSVAQYGISRKGDPELEKTLLNLFCETLKMNFSEISRKDKDTDFIQCIFASMKVDFPEKFEDFFKLSDKQIYDIAMTFSSTAIGALIHSTVNTLDWALARLLKDEDKMQKFSALMAKYPNLNLADETVFEKDGPLGDICEWVLHNVYLHPPFSHEFFLNSKPFTANLQDNFKMTVPGRGFIIVNYGECNRTNKEMTAKPFTENLNAKSTTARFLMNNQVASFGGSITDQDNKKSRRCPGAKTSLYEQMVIIGNLMKYSFFAKESPEISLKVDRNKHPLHTREDKGEVVVKKRPVIGAH